MKIEIQGLKELQELFKKLDERSKKDILVELADKTFDEAKKRIAKHHKTGKMEHNLYKKLKLSDMQAAIGIEDDGMLVGWKGKKVNYAVFVHFGTQPHYIHPKFKKALRWTKESADKTTFAFAKAVHHPGYEGDPFLYDALDMAGKEVTKIFERFIDGL